jgi:hypothetical protein
LIEFEFAASGGPALPKASRVAAVAGLIFVGFVVWVVGGWTHGTARLAFSDVVLLECTIPAFAFSAFAARAAEGRLRLAWVR